MLLPSSMVVRPVVLQDPPKHPFPHQLPFNNSSRSVSPLDATLTQVLILRHLKSFKINTYTKTGGRAPLPASQFVNSLLPPTILKPDISATVTSPATPLLSIACGQFCPASPFFLRPLTYQPDPSLAPGFHLPSIFNFRPSTSSLRSQRLCAIQSPVPLGVSAAEEPRFRLHRLQKVHLRKSFVCHSYTHLPLLSPFPATLTKTPGAAYRFFPLLGVGASAPTPGRPQKRTTSFLRICAFRIPVVTGASRSVCSSRAEMPFPIHPTRITDHALATAHFFHSVCPASRTYVTLRLANSLASRHASPSAANVLSLLCLRRAFQGGSPSSENPSGMGQSSDRLPGVEQSNDWITHVLQTSSLTN